MLSINEKTNFMKSDQLKKNLLKSEDDTSFKIIAATKNSSNKIRGMFEDDDYDLDKMEL